MLLKLAGRFKKRIGATAALVVLEAVIDLLFPLFIGIAINGLLDDRFGGVIALGALGIAALTIGSARRFFDTRAYNGIYEIIATEMTAREQQKGTRTSTIAARTTLLREFVEFLENSMPEIVNTIIGTVGMLIIIGGLNLNVFWACLALLALVLVVYRATSSRNYHLNAGYNDELEQQITALDSGEADRIGGHFKMLMRWNRRLSDLETVNYIAIWLGVIALLIYAPIQVIQPGTTEYGFAFSTIIYVFQYIEALVALPIFLQQAIRLNEISSRLTDNQP